MLTKALPGCITNATIKSLELMQSMPERRHQLWENIGVLRSGLREAGFNIGDPKGAVTSIYTRGAMALTAVRMLMEEHKIIVNPVMYPAVPYGTSIIRMTTSALHTPADMQRLVEAIVDVSKKIPLLEGNVAAASKVAAKTAASAQASAAANGAASSNGSAH
jgi:glycine C-acetyltransferase